MITLHYHPGNASFAAHLMLRELGLAHELAYVDRAAGAHRSPAYLALNPNGLIPVLVDGDLVLYETAAILLHLADTHPAAALAPSTASAERARLYQWLCWISNTFMPAMNAYFYPERWVGDGAGDDGGGDPAAAAARVKRRAEARAGDCLAQLDALLAGHGGPWLLGEGFGAADPLAFIVCRWTRGFTAEAPARERPRLGPYLQRMLARPAVQEALRIEGLQPPWV